jgi:hypothetical protein
LRAAPWAADLDFFPCTKAMENNTHGKKQRICFCCCYCCCFVLNNLAFRMYVDKPLMIKSEDGERWSISCRGVAVCNCARARECGSLQVMNVARAFLGRKRGRFSGSYRPGGVGWGGGRGRVRWVSELITESKFPSEGNRTPDPESFFPPKTRKIFDPGIFPPGSENF